MELLRKDSDLQLRNPKSLFELCVRCVQSNLRDVLLAEKIPMGAGDWTWKKKSFKLKRDGIYIPGGILEHVLVKGFNRPTDEVLWLRLALARTDMSQSITILSLRNCEDLDDNTLARLMNTKITSLDIHGCRKLSFKTFNVINTYGANLRELIIGNSVNVLPTSIFRSHLQDNPSGWKSRITKFSTRISRLVLGEGISSPRRSPPPPLPSLEEDCGSLQEEQPSVVEDKSKKKNFVEPYFRLCTPKLNKLVIWGHHVQQVMSDPKITSITTMITTIGGSSSQVTQVDYWKTLLGMFLEGLKYLDISHCTGIKTLGFLLEAVKSLEVLVLHDVHVPETEEGWGVIKQLRKLRFLDVSSSVELAALYRSPETLLPEMLDALHYLRALDVSGTNLAGSSNTLFDNRRFSFLGLVCTHFQADRRGFEAERVAGMYGEEQIITSVKHYMNRPGMLKKALRALLDAVTNYEDFQYIIHAHTLMAEILEIHTDDKAVITLAFSYLRKPFTSGGMSRFDVRERLSHKLRLRIAQNIISIIEGRMNEPEMFLGGIYVLKHYKIFDFSKRMDLAEVILRRLEMGFPNPDDLWWVQWMLYDCVIILKEILATVEGCTQDLIHLVAFGTIKILCKIVEALGSRALVQDSLYVIWGLMNCFMNHVVIGQAVRPEFITHNGLTAFITCIEYRGPRDLRICPKIPALCCISTVSEMGSLRKHFLEQPKIINYLRDLVFGRSPAVSEFHGAVLKSNVRLLAMTSIFNLLIEPEASVIYDGDEVLYTRALEQVIASSDDKPEMVEALRYNDIYHLIELIESKTIASQMFGMWVIYVVVKLDPATYIPMMAPFVQRCVEFSEANERGTTLSPYNIEFLKPALKAIDNFPSYE